MSNLKKVNEYNGPIERLAIRYSTAISRLDEIQDQLDETITNHKAAVETQTTIINIATGIQQQVHERLAGVVSRCLEAVFDDPYTLQIEFVQKRGATEAVLRLERDGHVVEPLVGAGGGVLDVAAFALRLGAIALCRPPIRRLLVLDEPFRFVSVKHQMRVKEMLEKLSKEMGVQFIMITHNNELVTGKVVEVAKGLVNESEHVSQAARQNG